MKKFFYCADYTGRENGIVTSKFIWGIYDFNLNEPLEYQIIRLISNNTNIEFMGNLKVTAFNPVELDSSNHTDRVMELFRIWVNNREYYGGMNTNAYVNKELAKLGLSL
ncbi:hypothetical protein [Vibrio harveyi]|uniref:hypothetical protein n=1 Tax=Vibrio harveyi TaxID=669 RepID=UPI0025AF7212|nr:hypothetical protein [Vibrio harveyi]WJT09249.1 hypothetical protein PH545_24800 [Vibrio harveyi]